MRKSVRILKLINWFIEKGRRAISTTEKGILTLRGFEYSTEWEKPNFKISTGTNEDQINTLNPLREYFNAHREGRGIWKWNHYFDIYHKHFKKFVGKEVHIVEIGIFSGGSLDMWKHYFGPGCHVYGVDIQDECRAYEGERVKIFIGDQADREFWKKFKDTVPRIDIVIDDGGHKTEQQIVTLEEMLPHISPSGVYLCEDVHGASNGFSKYVYGLDDNLNTAKLIDGDQARTAPTPFQRHVHAIHHYPYAIVIERNSREVSGFVAPRNGTQWEAFL